MTTRIGNRQYVLALIQLLLFCKLVSGQNFQFQDTSAIWSVYDEKYFTTGDSLFNGKTYSIMHVVKDSVITEGKYFALVRQDTLAEKVYIVDTLSSSERLLYDFTLSVGDSIDLKPYAFDLFINTTVRVKMIDSVLLGGVFRKRLTIEHLTSNSFYSEEYWIEGIGSTAGLFSGGIIGFSASQLTYPLLFCYELGGALIYQAPNVSTCYEPRTISTLEYSLNFGFELYPNPASHTVKIVLNENSFGNLTKVSILDVGGRISKTVSTRDNIIQLDLSSLSPGIYTVVAETNEDVAVRKLFLKATR